MIHKVIILFLISSVKFIFAFPLAVRYDFSFHNTLLITSAGGISGVLFFAFFSEEIIVFYNWFVYQYLVRYPRTHRVAKAVKSIYHKVFPKKEKKIFSPRSKRFVRIKQTYGLIGISVLTPLLLSIPLGTFLAIRFYKRTNKTIFYLCAAVVMWSFIVSMVVHFAGFRY